MTLYGSVSDHWKDLQAPYAAVHLEADNAYARKIALLLFLSRLGRLQALFHDPSILETRILDNRLASLLLVGCYRQLQEVDTVDIEPGKPARWKKKVREPPLHESRSPCLLLAVGLRDVRGCSTGKTALLALCCAVLRHAHNRVSMWPHGSPSRHFFYNSLV